jgi:preprotein translocase subunit SecD
MSNLKSLAKNWRIWILVAMLLYSIISLIPYGANGAVITAIDANSDLYGKVQVGDTIDWANEKQITSQADLQEFETFTGIFRYSRNGNLELTEIKKPGIGLTIQQQDSSKLNFGMDLIGGTRVLIQADEPTTIEIMEQALATLQTRINIYGLKESKFQLVEDVSGNQYIQIEMAGGSISEVEELLEKQGEFEGKISQTIQLIGGTGEFLGKVIEKTDCNINSQDELNDSTSFCVNIDNELLTPENSITINEIEFSLLAADNSTVILGGTAFASKDIRSVCIQDQPGVCTSRIFKKSTGWEFNFQVFIEEAGAQRFADLTRDSKIITDPTSGSQYLETKLLLFLDDGLIDELSIAPGLAGQAYQEPVITGFRESQDEAVAEKLQMQSILQSGSLPVKMTIIKIDQISATLGQEFLASATTAGLIGVLAIAIIIFIRYRNIKIAIPVLFTSLSEVIIILGAATVINWTIDLAAIAGIIAAVGTGVDSQIMIIDEILYKSEHVRTLKQKIKRAFFIIMGSAATTIAAMIPLMIIGIGVMRGFAIVTTIGVLVGILITRPAFGAIAEAAIGETKTE